MDVAWIKKTDGLNFLLAGFDFSDMRGVVNKNKAGIKLGICDEMSKVSLNDSKTHLPLCLASPSIRMFGNLRETAF